MENKLRIAICEDLPADIKLLVHRIKESKIPVIIEVYKNGEEFMEKFQSGLYHLIYLDIYMNGLTGIETADAIRRQDKNVMLAFTTASSKHTYEANKFRSLLYIEKPVTQEMINHTLDIACAVRDRRQTEVLTVPTDKKKVDIQHDELIYIEVANHRCILHLLEKRQIEVSTAVSIETIERSLPKPRFCRTHRAYIVNLDYVDYSNGTDFIMINNQIAYIARKNYRQIIKDYDNWLFNKAREGL